ncbi:RidA family protein [Caulobacter sp. S45]|uniref:RidA family protein n=1 Tax=Caulobacter sp. S45 TaxID=1641861 RepID=UPI001C207723|nr:Rid family hydrolase [Caulobacter sp. S45]
MRPLEIAVLVSLACASSASAEQASNRHFAMEARPLPAGAVNATGVPAFSAAVMAGDTLYISGSTDIDPATGKPPVDPKVGAKLILDGMKRTVERAGMTMDDLVWVQVFASDLSNYATFNEVYRTYFKGPLPARAFLGAGSLLANSHYEVMGVAVKSKK